MNKKKLSNKTKKQMVKSGISNPPWQNIDKTDKKNKEHVYTLGSPDPRSYASFNGCDVYTFVKKSSDKQWNNNNIDTSIQGMSIKINGKKIEGSLIKQMAFSSLIIEMSRKSGVDIKLSGSNEFGHVWEAYIYGLKITGLSWGLSIDDTSMEELYNYSAKKYIGWKKIKRS